MTPDLGSEVPAARESVVHGHWSNTASCSGDLASTESDDGGMHNTLQVIRRVPDGSLDSRDVERSLHDRVSLSLLSTGLG